jgi:hypothetical protein
MRRRRSCGAVRRRWTCPRRGSQAPALRAAAPWPRGGPDAAPSQTHSSLSGSRRAAARAREVRQDGDRSAEGVGARQRAGENLQSGQFVCAWRGGRGGKRKFATRSCREKRRSFGLGVHRFDPTKATTTRGRKEMKRWFGRKEE